MRSRCEAFEEAIWDHVRFGTELPTEAIAHISQCAQCERTMVEARQIAGMVTKADCVPAAPDCRRAVMARIWPVRKQPRMAWAYACAGLAVASVAIGSIVFVGPGMQPGGQGRVTQLPQPAQDNQPEQPRVKQRPASDSREVHNNTHRRDAQKPTVDARPRLPKNDMIAKVPQGPEIHVGDAYDSPSAPQPMAPAPSAPKIEMAFSTVGRAEADKSSIHTDQWISTGIGELDARSSVKADSDSSLKDRLVVAEANRDAKSGGLSFASPQLDKASVALDGKSKFEERARVDAITANAPTDSSFGDRLIIADAAAPAWALKADKSERKMDAALYMRRFQAAVDVQRPVAIAVVDWGASQLSATDYTYAYTDRDPDTGLITNCSVQRSGDVVNIRLEAEPERTKPSERGSIDHANNTHA